VVLITQLELERIIFASFTQRHGLNTRPPDASGHWLWTPVVGILRVAGYLVVQFKQVV